MNEFMLTFTGFFRPLYNPTDCIGDVFFVNCHTPCVTEAQDIKYTIINIITIVERRILLVRNELVVQLWLIFQLRCDIIEMVF